MALQGLNIHVSRLYIARGCYSYWSPVQRRKKLEPKPLLARSGLEVRELAGERLMKACAAGRTVWFQNRERTEMRRS